jgi:hypothetical protein
MRTTFVSHTNIHRVQFWFLHYYLLRAIFVSRVDISCAFHSTHCTMPEFSTPPLRTNTLCLPLTKLSHDNIYPHCAHTNQTPLLCQYWAHHACHYYVCCTPCTPYYAYAHRTMLIFSVCTRTPTFFMCAPNFSTHTRRQHFSVQPKFSARTSTPIFFRAMPNFYISQAFYCATCIFSAPTYAHSFLCASIPREFRCRNWGFCLTFFPNLP